jgi:hypothetical protein
MKAKDKTECSSFMASWKTMASPERADDFPSAVAGEVRADGEFGEVLRKLLRASEDNFNSELGSPSGSKG